MESKKRLIDANTLLNLLKPLEEQSKIFKKILLIICNCPTVDAVEVIHGQWIKRNWSVTCSVCGSLAIAHDGKNYCPYCGAKMDGGAVDG